MNPFDTLRNGRHKLQRLIPLKVIASQAHGRIYKQFATKAGLVYFGYVDQRNDEHSLIRGMTVSTKHRDNHYCIGSYEGYDIALVERVDTIHHPGKPAKTHNWIIMTFDLQRSVDLPHVVVGSHIHSESFYAQLFTKFSHLAKVTIDESHTEMRDFLKKYTIYAKPDQILSAERLFSPTLAKVIAEQFNALTIEISEGSVYIYAENHRPTTALLESMLTKGMWLARAIDAHVDPTTTENSPSST